MLSSMTGYASISRVINVQGPQGNSIALQLNCEIKTINNRFFEVSSKLPAILLSLENHLANSCKQALWRGRVFLSITLNGEDLLVDKISVSIGAAQQYFNAVKLLNEKLGLEDKVRAYDLLKMPGVINVERAQLDTQLQQAVFTLVTDTLAQVKQSRATEGEALLHDLQLRLKNCTSSMESIKVSITALAAKLQQQVTELETQFKAEPENLLLQNQLEMAHRELEKSDINEEIIRFLSHVEKCNKLFASPQEEKGKQLDFICQELLRETNTIAAKSSLYEIIEQSVAIKVEIEKIKEQVQNLV